MNITKSVIAPSSCYEHKGESTLLANKKNPNITIDLRWNSGCAS